MSYSEKWIEILNEVSTFGKDRHLWFRGHSNAEYQLHSKLFRQDREELDGYLEDERFAFRYFKNFGHTLHGKGGWDLLQLMQQHGAVTRLLEWSSSFNTALFFATNNWRSGECACVWLLSPGHLNNLTNGENTLMMLSGIGSSLEDMIWQNDVSFKNNSLALIPGPSSSKMIAQQSAYTLQGNSLLPLDKEHEGRLLREDALRRILLTPDLREDVEQYLELSGVTEFTMSHDLNGLSRHINAYIV